MTHRRQRLFLYIGGILSAAATAGVLLTSAAVAGDLFSFQAPAGWPQLMNVNLPSRQMAAWRDPSPSHQGDNLLVIVRPYGGTLGQAAASEDVAREFPGAQISKQSTTVCGGHPAIYMYVVAQKNGRPFVSESMLSMWGSNFYSATYTRFDDGLPAARSALVTMCPPGASQSTTTSW